LKKYLIIFAFILFALQAQAATYTVSQDGTDKDYSIATFNAESGDFSNDTFYFSGAITTPIVLQIFGTSGNPVILDGYQTDDTTYQNLSESAGRASINTSSSVGIDTNGQDYITIQDMELTGNSTAMYIDGTGITLKRNYTYQNNNGATFVDAVNFTVGGSSGNGNVFKNNGVSTSNEDISITGDVDVSHDGIISYNHLYADSDSWGIDGIVFVASSYNMLIEYNSIHGHNHTTAQGENALDFKKDCHDIIVRYNDLYDYDYESIIILNGNSDPGESVDQLYIYGNRMHDSLTDAIHYQDNAGQTYDDVYIFSNLIYNLSGRAIIIAAAGPTTGTATWIFNNTISEVGTTPSDQYDVALHYSYGYTNFMNNIVVKSSTGAYSYRAINVQLSGLGEYLDTANNIYYWPSQIVGIDWEDQGVLSLAQIQAGSGDGLPEEQNSTEGDPGLVDWDNGDFTQSAGGASINSGVDLGDGAIATVTIQGVEYPVYWDAALGSATDWSNTIPSVEILRRDSTGGAAWDVGAYEYRPSGSLKGMTIR